MQTKYCKEVIKPTVVLGIQLESQSESYDSKIHYCATLLTLQKHEQVGETLSYCRITSQSKRTAEFEFQYYSLLTNDDQFSTLTRQYLPLVTWNRLRREYPAL